MKPVVHNHKHSGSFSIDSIIRRDSARCETCPFTGASSDNSGITVPVTPPDSAAIAGRIPPLHPALPPHVRNLLLTADQGHSQGPSDLLSLHRSAAWAFQNSPLPPVYTLGRLLPPSSPVVPLQPAYPGIGAPVREQYPVGSPWPIPRGVPGLLYPFSQLDTSFYFHPYRKPKRIRTAFSPSQLLKLEHAFEKNHYVVGQERKDLAAKLNLTETQVTFFQ
ncbi:hypothetical protein FSP39_023905 [Pinctada imbricata]|uniref:Homeobox domain-containing protein n=1 Tax=Pinctada imbricata TaxID=66713 RepID=A0AA88Y277_PINIB|nr:hypothetical protein FSP39_023905 [Pinctada imbricata]